ncbi:hypothetical protein HHK36_009256 [Tetracentron sinense]|uniref:Uncharacterized protein n=1 Tax=Tetracentron sinense TaxID=13715 RepID=A0A835DHB6_TETSI|nr:hypothetical protein HHK36_009256 [Tetracentron sinense]
MEKSEAVRIDRKSSIESEPRTLNIEQIQYAREEALYVLNTKSIEEALRIFTQGLEPIVMSTARQKGNVIADSSDELDCFIARLKLPRFKDVVSAPF